MAGASRLAGRARARRWAAYLVMLVGLGCLGAAGPAYPQVAPDLGFAPSPPGAPAAPAAPGYAPGAPPPPGARNAAPARGRGITRAEFIERRRQAATRRGRDPERAAAHAARLFDQADTNRDGIVDAAERAAFEAAHPELMRRGQRGQ